MHGISGALCYWCFAKKIAPLLIFRGWSFHRTADPLIDTCGGQNVLGEFCQAAGRYAVMGGRMSISESTSSRPVELLGTEHVIGVLMSEWPINHF